MANRYFHPTLAQARLSGGKVEEIGRGVLDPAGHLSYLPGNEWILNHTYPQGKARMQTPHLYHVKSGRRVDLGHFHLPKVYSGEWILTLDLARTAASSVSTAQIRTQVDSFI